MGVSSILRPRIVFFSFAYAAMQININEQLDSNAYVMVMKYGMPTLC